MLCQLIEIKVRKDTLVMPETLMMSLQVKTLIVQVIKTLMELLDKGPMGKSVIGTLLTS